MSLSWPAVSVQPTRWEWWLETATQEHIAPLSGDVQTQELPGARWACRAEYHNVQVSDARLLMAFIAQMRGRAGRVATANLAQPTIRGTATPVPTIKVIGANQTGVSLLVDGITPGTGFLPGDLFGLEDRLYMVLAAVTADGLGQATLSLGPPIWTAPANNAPLTIVSPTIDMMFRGDRQGWAYEPGYAGLMTFIFDLIEAR